MQRKIIPMADFSNITTLNPVLMNHLPNSLLLSSLRNGIGISEQEFIPMM